MCEGDVKILERKHQGNLRILPPPPKKKYSLKKYLLALLTITAAGPILWPGYGNGIILLSLYCPSWSKGGHTRVFVQPLW
jgi:hypothetical protein